MRFGKRGSRTLDTMTVGSVWRPPRHDWRSLLVTSRKCSETSIWKTYISWHTSPGGLRKILPGFGENPPYPLIHLPGSEKAFWWPYTSRGVQGVQSTKNLCSSRCLSHNTDSTHHPFEWHAYIFCSRFITSIENDLAFLVGTLLSSEGSRISA